MRAKYVPVYAALISILMIFACSCSEESLTGTSDGRTGDLNPRQLEKMGAGIDTRNEKMCLVAVNDKGDVVSLKVCDSIDEIGFPLSIRQMRMIETHDVAVISDRDLISEIAAESSYGEALFDTNFIILLALSSHDLDDVPWHCIKVCVGSDDYESCVITCMGKKPKR